jgi:gamma-glutamyltranspeptidase/glutathione hydrolase
MRFASRRSNVMARNGLVATSQPLAAMAGLRILMDGGNAVDAAVATAATLAVVEPHSTGVGGDVFALVRMAADGQVRALNASGRAPAAASREQLLREGLTSVPELSPFAITVPGAVSGWQAALDAHGSMPLSDLLKPAIEYASNGYPVSEVISSAWETSVEKLRAHPSGKAYLLNGGAPNAREVFGIPDLARTLQAVAEGGAEAFYSGPVAERTAKFVQELGGWLTVDDMARHRADWVQPISTDYRGVQCWQVPPNSQGINLLMGLNLAEGFDFTSMGLQSPATYHHLIECVRLALDDGLRHVTDPGHMAAGTDWLLSKKRANERRAMISADHAMLEVEPSLTTAQDDTVYITCVDGQGNACSLINSIFKGFGSGLVVPETGILLHNRGASFSLDEAHVNALEPGKRPYHTLMPGMVTRSGELWLCYGVMGAMQQAQGHLQVLVNMIDFAMDPQSALDSPRFSVRLGEGVAIEDIAASEVAGALENLDHPITVEPPHGVHFGGGQVIERDPETGVLTGGSEPRLDGAAVGW